MYRNSSIIKPGRLSLTVKSLGHHKVEDDAISRFIAGSVIRFEAVLKGPAKQLEPLLHTNLPDGVWKYIPFQPDKKGFSLEIELKSGGLFSYRAAAANDEEILLSPENYRRVLIDPEQMDGLAMYTLIPKASGKTADWIKMLPEIAEMGFNVIHLLPVSAMGRSESPYSSSDLFSLDKAWGEDIDDFRAFANEAAERGIRLCLDIVLNHIGIDNPICRQRAEWIAGDGTWSDGMRRAGCWHAGEWLCWEDLVLLNYKHPDARIRKELYEYMRDYVFFWIDAAGGCEPMIRLDNLHSSDREYISWLIPELRSRYPDLLILSEYFDSLKKQNMIVEKWGINLLTANSWEYPFAPMLQEYLESLHNMSGDASFMIGPSSHDTGSIPEMFGTADSSLPRYLCCALMGTGQTGIVQGLESGVERKTDFIGREHVKIQRGDRDFSGIISEINRLMRSESCFRIKGNAEFLDTGSDSLIVCRRQSGDSEFIIAANMDTAGTHDLYLDPMMQHDFVVSVKAERESAESSRVMFGPCGVCVLRCGTPAE